MDHNFQCVSTEPPELSFAQTTLIFISTLQLGLLFSFALVSYFHAFMFRDDITEEDEVIEVVDFTDKYPIEDATQTAEIEKINQNSYVLDFSPKGIIIMRYNYDEEGFEYWANSKTIKYDVLETMARKYVKVNCCSDLYINREEEIEQKKEAIKENGKRQAELELMNKEDKLEEEEEEESVFANFKSYNTKTKNGTSTTSSNNSKTIVADRSNKYIHRGNVSEFELLKPESQEVETTVKKIDFSTYREMFLKEMENSVENNVENNDENNVVSNDVENNVENNVETANVSNSYFDVNTSEPALIPPLPISIETSEESLSDHSLETKKHI